jgi:hypothetical protein
MNEGDSRAFCAFIAFRVDLFSGPKQKCLAKRKQAMKRVKKAAVWGQARMALS